MNFLLWIVAWKIKRNPLRGKNRRKTSGSSRDTARKGEDHDVSVLQGIKIQPKRRDLSIRRKSGRNRDHRSQRREDPRGGVQRWQEMATGSLKSLTEVIDMEWWGQSLRGDGWREPRKWRIEFSNWRNTFEKFCHTKEHNKWSNKWKGRGTTWEAVINPTLGLVLLRSCGSCSFSVWRPTS